MRKKILGAVIIAAMAVAAGWNFYQSQSNVTVNSLVIANIEALAAGEGGPAWGYSKLVYQPKPCCKDDPYLDCPGTYGPC